MARWPLEMSNLLACEQLLDREIMKGLVAAVVVAAGRGFRAGGIAAARACGAAIPALAVADTVKTVDPSGVVTGTIERAQLRLVQTPQAFAFATLLAAHQRARAAGREDFSDDAALAEWAGIKVTTFEGEAANVNLTTAADFARAGAVELAALPA